MKTLATAVLCCLAWSGAALAQESSTKVYSLTGVAFEFNSDKLLPSSNQVLDDAAKMLKEDYKGAGVEVAGHTDFTGNEAFNKDLSQRRAEAVRQYLIQAGVEADHLTAVGYGSSQPVADNHTKAGRAKNRRVELRTSIFHSRP
jgi:OOP family OmpA-OmpF porin